MSTLIRYKPDDRLLDLEKLSHADYALIVALHGDADRGQGKLVCLESSPDDDPAPMFIRCADGVYWAAHWAGCAHGSHPIAVETDEHRRQKEYWHRAAVEAGHRAIIDLPTGGDTILDVAIDGANPSGIEVQHSYLGTAAAKSRTARSCGAGWLPVWFVDSDARPPWFHEVPAMSCNPMRWERLPNRRTATALGLSVFTSVKCTPGAFGRCPAGRTRACGAWHPKRSPWPGLTVDDVAERLPEGDIVPMRDSGGHVHLVSPASLELYRGLTDLPSDYLPRGPARRRQGAAPNHCACGQQIYPLAQLVRERDDLCEACRIKLGLPAPRLRP